MTDKLRPGTLWTRHRMTILIAGVAAWVGLVTALHYKGVWGGGGSSSKGATELLEIGALPVT